MKITETKWYPAERLVVTHISGHVDEQDISKWQQSLEEVLNRIEDNSRFKIFVNLHGFKAVNFDAHKKFRVIIPSTLADYGFRAGYLGLFPEAEVHLKNTRGIQCVAAVHVHQDDTKINNYDTNSVIAQKDFSRTQPLQNSG
jgi:hypothetical protein